MLMELNKDSFEREVLNETEKLVLVDFWAPWCPPCRMQTPILEKFAAAYGDYVKVVKVNTEDNEELARTYQIANIPSLLVFQSGTLTKKAVGVQNPAALKTLCGV